VRAVRLDTGETVAVETLLWTPEKAPAALIENLVEGLGLELDPNGYVVVEKAQGTNVAGLWAAADVQGWMGSIESATGGGLAAFMIAHGWYADEGAVASLRRLGRGVAYTKSPFAYPFVKIAAG
jgi:thioredoxin reductase